MEARMTRDPSLRALLAALGTVLVMSTGAGVSAAPQPAAPAPPAPPAARGEITVDALSVG
jgi:hypothetical protein